MLCVIFQADPANVVVGEEEGIQEEVVADVHRLHATMTGALPTTADGAGRECM